MTYKISLLYNGRIQWAETNVAGKKRGGKSIVSININFSALQIVFFVYANKSDKSFVLQILFTNS